MYQDLAKWMFGFVPVASLGALVAAMATNGFGQGSALEWAWFQSHPAAIAGFSVALVSAGVLTWLCARVLLAGPQDWVELSGDDEWLNDAFSKRGIGTPWFNTSESFITASTSAPATGAKFTPADVETVRQRCLTLSAEQEAKRRFALFCALFMFGAAGVAAGAAAVAADLGNDPARFHEPTKVTVHVPFATADEVWATTGCGVPDQVTAVAVAGTFAEPVLEFFGTGCHVGRWHPPANKGVRITKA